MKNFQHIAVYGGGSWGTALAAQIARTQEKVMLFLRDPAIINEVAACRTNKKYLGNITLPNNIYPSDEFSKLAKQEVIIIAVPSRDLTNTIELLRQLAIPPQLILLIATKGLCANPTQLISERIKAIFPNPLAFISGPNFAREVAQGLLTAATIAAEDKQLAQRLKACIATDNFTVTTTADIVTVQIAGIVKNIIAIQSGFYEGSGYKENARAALLTQGLHEIMTLSRHFGGKSETIFEPAVLGDLVLTCYSKTSRNTKFGYELAKAIDKEQFLNNYPNLVEGKESIKLVIDWVKDYNLNLPIISAVARSLNLKPT